MELKRQKTKPEKRSWKDVSINDYFEIQELLKDDTIELSEKEVRIVSILSGLSEEEIWNMQIDEFKRLQETIDWSETATLRQFDKLKFKQIELNDVKYVIETDLTKFTVAQYIDFQTFWPKRDQKDFIAAILACFLIPKGKEYANGYDISKTKDDILSYLDIQTAYEIMGFFLWRWQSLTAASLDYLSAKMKRMQKKNPKEDYTEKIEQIENLRKNISDGFQLLIQ